MLSTTEQYLRADKLIDAVCKVGRVTYGQFISHKKSLVLNVLRGLTYVIARDMKIHPKLLADMMCRTRGNCINVCNRYRAYIQSGDILTVDLYNQVLKELQK